MGDGEHVLVAASREVHQDHGVRAQRAAQAHGAGEGVRAYLGRTGQRQVHLDGWVDHLGYVRARAAARDKKARDVRLLEQALAAKVAELVNIK